ncbi:MAG: tyrosine-type recombinase/integrase [Flavobacteriales bacterium]
MKWVPYPKKSKRLPVVIAQEELNSRISSIENLKHKCVCMLLYGCGLRRAELLNLKVADVDSQRMLVFVRHGKGAKDRMVPISEEMLSTLRMYWKSYRPKEFLIEGAQGGRYSPQSVLKVCYKHVGVKPHTLRHCYATHLHENGVDIKTIQELLGHANVKTTEIYTHVSSATLAKVQVPLKLAA